MGVNLYNSERYYDPTAHDALVQIEREAKKSAFRPLVYICAPLSGDVFRNISKVQRYCRFAVDSGCIPIAPHLFFPQFMDDSNPKERNLALFMDTVLLTKCSQVWVFGSRISKGMGIELEKAKQKKMCIRYFSEDCREDLR